MNGDMILNTIPKLQKLSTKQLALISSAIDSFLVVQQIEKVSKNSAELAKLVSVLS